MLSDVNSRVPKFEARVPACRPVPMPLRLARDQDGAEGNGYRLLTPAGSAVQRATGDLIRAVREDGCTHASAECGGCLAIVSRFRDWIQVLQKTIAIGEGDRAEVELALHALHDAVGRSPAESVDRGDPLVLAVHIAAAWAHGHLHSESQFHRFWREAYEVPEYEALYGSASNALLGKGSRFGFDPEAQALVLDFMAGTLQHDFGNVSLPALERIMLHEPLSIPDHLSLSWFRAGQATPDGPACVDELARALGTASHVVGAAIAMWVANSSCFEAAARRWGWHWVIDVSRSLSDTEARSLSAGARAPGAAAGLTRRSMVRRIHEVSPETERLPVELRVRTNQAIPLALLGSSGKGKSSLFTAWVHESARDPAAQRVRLHPRQDAQSGYRGAQQQWRVGQESATASQTSCSWFLLPPGLETELPWQFEDYRGEDLVPQKFPRELQASVEAGHALFFVIDDDELGEGEAADEQARRTAQWYAQLVLEHRRNHGAPAGDVPIGLIVNKADKLLGAVLPDLLERGELRTRILGPEVDRRVLHASVDLDRVPEQLGAERQQLRAEFNARTPFERLCRSILQQPANNRRLAQRQVLERLVDRFQVFIEACLATTSNFEMFLTVAVPGAHGLVGVREPVHWWSECAIAPFLEDLEEALGAERVELSRKLDQVGTALARHDQLVERRSRLARRRHKLELKVIGRGWLLGSLGRRVIDTLEKDMARVDKSIQGTLAEILGISGPSDPDSGTGCTTLTAEAAREVAKGMQWRFERMLREQACVQRDARVVGGSRYHKGRT